MGGCMPESGGAGGGQGASTTPRIKAHGIVGDARCAPASRIPSHPLAPSPLSPHSYRNAMIGSNLDARLAGQIPKKTPTKIEKPIARTIAIGATAVFQFWKCFSA